MEKGKGGKEMKKGGKHKRRENTGTEENGKWREEKKNGEQKENERILKEDFERQKKENRE